MLTLPFFVWQVLSDEQMSKEWPFSLLNDEQMSNKVRVEHQPVVFCFFLNAFLGSMFTVLPFLP